MLMKLLPLLFLILASPRDGAADGATGLQTLEEIQQCSRQNEPKRSAKQTIELISVDRIGRLEALAAAACGLTTAAFARRRL